MNPSDELAIMDALDAQKLLNSVANRENVESTSAVNFAVAKLYESRAALRHTLRRCAVAASLLAVSWSVFAWVVK